MADDKKDLLNGNALPDSRQRAYAPKPVFTYPQQQPYNPARGPNGRGWKSSAELDDYDARWTGVASAMDRATALWRKYVSGPSTTLPTMVNGGSAARLTTSNPPPPMLASLWSMLTAANIRFIVLCTLWYTSSAMSSNTAKPLLSLYRFPVTLTFLQFGFVAAYCLVCFSPALKLSTLRSPTNAIMKSTLPMALFQVGGHIFSSMAISRVPVSTVHTIKALSPLFTVGAYAMVFGVTYSPKTYLSLLPLTLGVMLACTFDITASSIFGLACAFGSTLVVVSSNIFFKKVMPSKPTNAPHVPGTSHKLDKLNLLFYTSGLAFVFMIPLWFYYDVGKLWAALVLPNPENPGQRATAAWYLFLNVTVHFAQNLIAFALLSITSPVTYSIASLVKRIAVICMAILYFNQSVHLVQAIGIMLAGVGLLMYNNAKSDIEKGEKRAQRISAARDLQLPLTREELAKSSEDEGLSHSTSRTATLTPLTARNPAFAGKIEKPSLISIPSAGFGNSLSPADNYPSPPDSRDSPPLRASDLHADVPGFEVDEKRARTFTAPAAVIVH